MHTTQAAPPIPAITGNTMQLGDRHSIAIHHRDGRCWVAEFHEGRGELVDAASWFRSYLGALRYSHGRRLAALATLQPMTQDVIDRVEALHREAGRRDAAIAPIFEAVLSMAQRRCAEVAARIRGSGAGRMRARGRPVERLSR
jgi:hypothetical protein